MLNNKGFAISTILYALVSNIPLVSEVSLIKEINMKQLELYL